MNFGDVVRFDAIRRGEPVPNTDPETGVRYGVASGDEIPDWFWEECEGVYPACEECPDGECECAMEASSWIIDDGTFQAESTDGIHVMVYRSPRIVNCRECSPCYPCAGDLGSLDDDGVPTYGFPE